MPLPIKFNKAVADKLKDKELAEKMKSAKKSIPKANNIFDVLEIIKQDVDKNLGQYEKEYQVIRDKATFLAYIQKANEYGMIAIDTETKGLNPMVDDIVGICLYFPGEKATYVPINHVEYYSGILAEDQITKAEAKEVLEQLTAKVIYHNAQFDIRVLKHQIGVYIPAYWDTLIGAQLLDENEAHGLKYLHGKYISKSEEKTFGELFGKIGFHNVPIQYAYLYAAHDAIDTFELYEFQAKYINEHSERQDRRDLYWVFTHIEIPMIEVIVDLEDTGVAIDTDYLQTLHDKYHKNLNDALDACNAELANYKDQIDKYNAMHVEKPFEIPINIASPTQLAILFYDILHCKPAKGAKNPRGTDVEVLSNWKEEYPIAKAILDYRAALKITSTYVDNIPKIMHTDGRVHTHFNSNGAKTGRMSSSDPINLQNIPSHSDDIRKMFVGQTTFRDVQPRESDHAFIFDRCEEVQLKDESWKFVEELQPGDELIDGEIVKVVKVKQLRVLVGIQ